MKVSLRRLPAAPSATAHMSESHRRAQSVQRTSIAGLDWYVLIRRRGLPFPPARRMSEYLAGSTHTFEPASFFQRIVAPAWTIIFSLVRCQARSHCGRIS